MWNGKGVIIHFIIGLVQKKLYKMGQYFPKRYEPVGGHIDVRIDLSNYPTKTDLKNRTWVNTFKSTSKSDLASLKAELDKRDVRKLKIVPVDLSKLVKQMWLVH